MKLSYFCMALPLLVLTGGLHAQNNSRTPVHAVSTGSKCPDADLHFLYTKQPARLSGYAGKIIILDFFSSVCGACIASLPRLNALQQQNNTALQIMLVTSEPVDNLAALFAANKLAKQNRLPVIINDKQLGRFFPHTLLPHEVWISNGRVRAITGSDAVTQDNITALIHDKDFSLPLKEDLLNFDAAKPLFDSGNGGSAEKIFFRSTFSQAIPGVKSKTAVYSSGASKRFLCLNQSLTGLYQEALNGLASNRILFKPADAGPATALYCYELLAPQSVTLDALHAMLLQDIARSFSLQGSYRQQTMLCYRLVNKTGSSLPAAEAANPVLFAEDSVTFSRAIPLPVLTGALNDAAKNATAIFLTGDTLSLPAGLSIDLTKVHTAADLQQQLLVYGIGLLPARDPLTMFVVTPAGISPENFQNQQTLYHETTK